jgi:SPP1 gp7 family putative phage head morphogenesis protein
MATLNDELLDQAVSHSIDLQRYGNGAVARMLALLAKTDSDLFLQLTAALEKMPPERFTVQRLDSLLASVRALNGKSYTRMHDALQVELKDLTDYEAGYQKDLFESTLPAQVSVASVSVEQVYAAAMAQPFQGRLLKEWADSLEAGRMQRISDAIRIGYVENQTIAQIVQRLRGTRALRYNDGLIQIDRRHAEAVVRTAVSHTAAFAQERFYDQNAGLIKALRWTSVLDSRTSAICQALDGKLYPLKSGRRPPAHWNCRSTMTPVVKSFKELGLKADELPLSTRASIDGQVPADMTYQQWIKRQPAGRQNEILGNTKGKLFRDGGLEVDRFVDRSGHVFTLAELRIRDAAAFKRAGL